MIRTAFAATLAAAVAFGASAAATIQITEDFSTDPSSRWSLFGDTTRFQWNANAQNLAVEWDSSRPKSLFYVPLGRDLSRYDSFCFEFDLVVDDISAGHEEGKPWPMQICLGLLNTSATNAAWVRSGYLQCPNLVEFNYYPPASVDGYDLAPTVAPAFQSSSGGGYYPSMNRFLIDLPSSQVVHVSLNYDAELQTLTASWTTNGIPVGTVHQLVMGKDIPFGTNDDFVLNAFSISSHQSTTSYPGWDSSVLARGTVDNINIIIPPAPPIAMLKGGFSGAQWKMTFHGRTGYTYDLLRSQDLNSWTEVEENVAGIAGQMTLTDAAPPASKAFYRVRAN